MCVCTNKKGKIIVGQCSTEHCTGESRLVCHYLDDSRLPVPCYLICEVGSCGGRLIRELKQRRFKDGGYVRDDKDWG